MSIRSNTLPMGRDLAPELQDILRRNGMQAHIVRQGDGFALAVQGHDSPLLTYPINQQQMRAMVDWGTNSANKKAYNTLADAMPMVEWLWDFMAIVSVLANMDVCLGTDEDSIL